MSSSGGFILTGVKVNKRNDGWVFVEKSLVLSSQSPPAAKRVKHEEEAP